MTNDRYTWTAAAILVFIVILPVAIADPGWIVSFLWGAVCGWFADDIAQFLRNNFSS
jgi:hypothetical protein